MIEDQFGIELFSNKLKPGAADLWRAGVRAQLGRIAKVRSGRIVLSAIKWYVTQGRAVLQIMPFPKSGGRQALTGTRAEETPRPVFIAYSAESFRRVEADEAILHELVHAVRHMSGKRDTRCVGDVCTIRGALRLNFSNREEFFAVLVENIYRSDQTHVGKRLPLRAGNTSLRQPPDRDLADSFGFFASGYQTYDLVSQFCREHPVFANLLAAVRARFNPLAAYFKDNRRASQLSTGATRDIAKYEKDLFDSIDFNRYQRSLERQGMGGS